MKKQSSQDVAIIGYSFRFPGSSSKEELWEILSRGIVTTREPSPDRFSFKDSYDPNQVHGKSYVNKGSFVDDVSSFDSNLFEFSKSESMAMDPRARKLLECTWEGFEEAGINLEKLSSDICGVFIGAVDGEYRSILKKSENNGNYDIFIPSETSMHSLSGVVSYALNLRGPSLTLDTHFSSSLSALHLAHEHLIDRECNVAVVGASQILMSPDSFIQYSANKTLSPDCICRSFDKNANGFVMGEGTAVLILKRLEDALDDNDEICGVIKSSCVNHSGHDRDSIAQPSIEQKIKLISYALDKANIESNQINYVEAHGTGTPSGDAAEISALEQAYRGSRDAPLIVGSIKNNIGHLGPCAGLASVIKTILCLEKDLIPHHVNFESFNSELQIDQSLLNIPTEDKVWSKNDNRRYAGINSFSISGANAHTIIADFVPKLDSPSEKLQRTSLPRNVLFISAADKDALKRLAKRYIDFLSVSVDEYDDICYASALYRTHLKHRLCVIASSTRDAYESILEWLQHDENVNIKYGETKNSKTENSFITQPIDDGTVDESYLSILCQAYVSGHNIQWNMLYKNKYNRVSLPLYAFSKNKFWPLNNDNEPSIESKFYKEDYGNIQNISLEERKKNIKKIITQIVIDLLPYDGKSEIDPDSGLQAQGINSLLSEEFRKRLEDEFANEFTGKFPVTLMFTYPTINDICGYILGNILQVNSKNKHNNIFETGDNPDSIAIIGMSCRFPGGVDSADKFWDFLKKGGDAISDIPSSRFNIDEFYDSDPNIPDKTYVKKGGFIDNAEEFDAGFFEISPREALSLDPQHRLLLEVTQEAFEDSFLCKEDYFKSNTGIYIGMMSNEYQTLVRRNKNKVQMERHMATGNIMSTAAGRIAYLFGLEGPAITVDTACSSSLVAIKLACDAIKDGQCDMALAGGVNIIAIPDGFINFSKIRALSPDGHCKTFDKSADGYARSEGCGILVLKKLSKALADNDNIIGVIRSGSLNQDGRSSSLTAPNGKAQENLYKLALEEAKLAPNDISYIETHGTGTKLGDPIEIASISSVYSKDRDINNPLYLSSVKTNIGHAESAAGVAGVIKTVMSMQHKTLPKHINFTEINPRIDLDSIPAKIPVQNTNIELKNNKLFAAVNSFGISGTNATIILESFEPIDSKKHVGNKINSVNLLCISSKNKKSLFSLSAKYLELLKKYPEIDMHDLCFTTNKFRDNYNVRLAFVFSNYEELCGLLSSVNSDNDYKNKQGIYTSWSTNNNTIENELEELSPYLISVYDREFISKNDGVAKESSIKPNQDTVANDLAKLYCHGAIINWSLYYENNLGSKIKIPNYQFNRDAYWVDLDKEEDKLTTNEQYLYNVTWKKLDNPTSINADVSSNVVLVQSKLLNKIDLVCSKFPMNEFVAYTMDSKIHDDEKNISFSSRDEILQAVDTIISKIESESLNLVFLCPSIDEKCNINESNVYSTLLYFVQAIEQCVISTNKEINVKIVSHKAVFMQDLDVTPYIPHSIVSGMMACIMREITDIKSQHIDVDFEELHDENTLSSIVASSFNEPFLVLRGRDVYCKRLDPIQDLNADIIPEDFALSFSKRGSIDNLEFLYIERNPLGDDEIEIEVKFAGLNFRDVLNVMGMYPGEPGNLGCECSGIVKRVGTRVSTFKPGDVVMAQSTGTFSSHINVNHLLASKIPNNVSLADAAGIPIIFLTAFYSMKKLAQVKMGDYVLIHAATGGVGMAAIQVVINSGANVIATASTEEKRQLAISLGAKHAFNSRDTSFLDGVLEVTNGHGVDIVLNSLSGDMIESSLLSLKSNGTFIEIGKRNIWTSEQVKSVNPNIRYHIVAIDKIAEDEPELTSGLLNEIAQDLASSIIKPVRTKNYDIQECNHVFKLMGAGKHLGKIVFSMRDRAISIKPNGAYIITGGLGGLGLQICSWLVSRGAGCVVLLSRREVSSEIEAQINDMRQSECAIHTVQADVTDLYSVRKAFEKIDNIGFSISGIFHAAGCIDDGIITNQDITMYENTAAPKVKGATNLNLVIDEYNLRLDFVVYFSSIVSILGNQGQINYAAANSFMDSLSDYSNSVGRHSVCVNWGSISDVGMTAMMNSNTQDQFIETGVIPFKSETAINAFDYCVSSSVNSRFINADINWNVFLNNVPLAWKNSFLDGINQVKELHNYPNQADSYSDVTQSNDADQDDIIELLKSPNADKQKIVIHYLKQEICNILNISDPEKISSTESLRSMGMDSILSVDFRNKIKEKFANNTKSNIPVSLVFNYPTCKKIANYLIDKILKI